MRERFMLTQRGIMRERCVLYALLTACLLVAPGVGAQQLTGRVTDQLSGEPLAAVQVFIAGSGIGALSQQNGRYLLLNVPAGTHTLTAERIGYRSVTQQATVSAGETVVQDFVLNETALGLDEIVVTGTPGGTQRRAIGNSVATVEAAAVTRAVPAASLQKLLTGRAPGLQFARAVTDLGTGSSLDIRGVASLTLRSEPLIYVDGVRVNNDATAGPDLGHRGRLMDAGEVNVLGDFNPEDIESIEIIKGPAAATLYGTEASAGVIQIITKRGREGTPEFNLSVRQGINYIRNPHQRVSPKWACRDSFTPPCDESTGLFEFNPYEEANLLIREGAFPWRTKNLFQDGPSQSYNLDVRGGTQSIRYFLSASRVDDESFIWYNTSEANRMRGNVGVVFNENFSLDVSTAYMEGYTRFSNVPTFQGGIWEDLNQGNGYCLPRINPTACPRTMGFRAHLPSDAAKLEASRDYQRFTAGGTLNFTAGGWLTSRVTLGIDHGTDENTSLFPLETELSPVYQQTRAGEVSLERPVTTYKSLDWSATARLELNDVWRTATSVGAQFHKKTQSDFTVVGSGFPHPASRTVNQTPAASSVIKYDFIENKSLGFYVQEELSWNDRFFLTGAIRFDDNSAFGANFEAVTYPKLSATWVVSEESFWNVGLVSSLRLRGAWGRAGRQPDVFAGQNTYAMASGPGGTSMFDPASPGDPDVGPEVSTELELGFDAGLLDDRFAVEFTWFRKKTEDALLAVALPMSVGFAGLVDRNGGRIDNWGWEATLSGSVYESPGFSFHLDLAASHVDNEVKTLGGLANGNRYLKVGWPYPSRSARYHVMSGEFDPNGPIVDQVGRRISATCRSAVPLGDGTEYGRMPGPLVPCEEVSGSEDIWLGPMFDRYVFTVAPQISLLNNSIVIQALAAGHYGQKQSALHAAGCTLYHDCYGAKTLDPHWSALNSYRSWPFYDTYDASYWKLRQIGVRYSLPESLISRIGSSRASLSLSADEVAILWRKQEYVLFGWWRVSDPEVKGGNERTAISTWTNGAPLSSVKAELRLTF